MKTQPLLALFALFVSATCSYAELIRHWPFDNSLDDIVVPDSGTAIGAVTYAPDRNGNADSALSIDGSQAQYVSVTGGGGLNALTTGTIALWVKWTGLQDVGFANIYGAVSSRQHDGLWSNQIIGLSGNDPATATILWRPYGAHTENTAITGATAVGDGDWHHVAVTYTDGDHKLYLDGALDGSGSLAPEGKYFVRDDVNDPLGIGGWYGHGDSYSTSMIDDLMIFDTVLTEEEVGQLINPSPPASFAITSIVRDTGADELRISWGSQEGKRYDLLSNTDIDSPWTIFDGNSDIFSSPPTNTLILSPIPADAKRFFRIEEYPAPATALFTENFDGVDPEWDVGFDASDTLMNTTWQLGNPTGGATTGPAAANSGLNCYGTNISTDYGLSSNIWLRTPAINLIGITNATLTFQQWIDIDSFDLGDTGTVRVLDADDLPGTVTELAEVQANIQGINPIGWVEFSMELPNAALGENISLEFQFISNNDDDSGKANYSGWYIDDVVVSTQTP